MTQPLTIPLNVVLEDSDKLKILSKALASELREYINRPDIMPIDDFADINHVSRNYLLSHRGDFCIQKIGGKLVVNMIAWREKLQGR